jgi:predicted small secreted protein
MSANLHKERRNMKTIVALLALSFAFALAGCNTVRGAGQDIQKAGTAIEDAAAKKK